MDASVVVSAFSGQTHDDDWAISILESGPVSAPHLLPAEVCQVLRRRAATGAISAAEANQGLSALLELRTELHPFEPFADRVWELRHSISAYDAWYVAIAEALDAPLATMDRRLAAAPGPRCAFLVPNAGGVGQS